MSNPQAEIPLDPFTDGPTAGRRHETPACPTGLAGGKPEEDAPSPALSPTPAPLGVEKLEGRQESGRDAQDEAEKDEPRRP